MLKTKIGKIELSPYELEVKNWQPFNIEPLRGKDAVKTMKKGCEVLEKVGVIHWVSSGNLLGMVRDHKLIPHDTDIDVNVLLDWDTMGANIASKQIVYGLVASKFYIVRTIVYNNHFFQVASMDPETKVIFDICFFYKGIKPGFGVYLDPTGYLLKPMRYITTTKKMTFEGRKYSIPNHVESFLKWKYGKNWKTPTKVKRPWQEEAPNLQKWL